jgi:hypothetical protein
MLWWSVDSTGAGRETHEPDPLSDDPGHHRIEHALAGMEKRWLANERAAGRWTDAMPTYTPELTAEAERLVAEWEAKQ